MLQWGRINELCKTEQVRFCAIKPGTDPELYLAHDLIPGFIYTYSKIGWDMKNNGSLVYFINELGKFVPGHAIEALNGVFPN